MSEKELKRYGFREGIIRAINIAIVVFVVIYAVGIFGFIIADIVTSAKSVDISEPVVTEPKTERKKPLFIEAVDPMLETIPAKPVEEIVDTMPPAKELIFYDVPLDEDLQEHIIKICDSYNIEPSIVIAMIERESRFRADVVGDNGRSFGLMQIQERWHKDRMEKLGVTDLLDPYQNVLVGIDFLAELFEYTEDVEWVLMAYNGGMAYANRLASNGTVSSYAAGVLESAREMRSEVW